MSEPIKKRGAAEAGLKESVFEPKFFPNFEEYRAKYAASLADPSAFWGGQARELLTWSRDFDQVCEGGFEHGDVCWFNGGQLNASVQCVDRHVSAGKGDHVAIEWEGDAPGTARSVTYTQLLHGVCRIANAMLASGVAKGDTVAVYMPMVPELAMTMLACARIGAVHSVVFAGYSAEALRDRITCGRSQWVFTCDEGLRGGRTLPLKKIVDDALAGLPQQQQQPPLVRKVFTFQRTGVDLEARGEWTEGRDVRMDELCAAQRPYCPPADMHSEDPLFILFTSGSTGTPKGLVHSTAGYLLYAALTCREVFDLRGQGTDVHACVADCGWITGHTYIVYGPLCNGTTTVMFESTPLYPDAGRYWQLVERLKVTSFYTAPTAVRALMALGDEHVTKYDRSSLRVLGSVGEPINPEAWRWYFEVVGNGTCSVVDTYWQTETGGHLCTPLPAKTRTKPGSCTLPFYGVEPVVLDAATGKEQGADGAACEGVLCIKRPWPGVARTCLGDHPRFMATYLNPYPGLYFTGDGCRRDEDGYYWITGRVDDVLNCSGHRLGTAEIEAALCTSAACAEAAVVGFPHPIKGQGICCYVVLAAAPAEAEAEAADEAATIKALKTTVRGVIGAFATPDLVALIPGLPKTRSGKIMRRILRKVVAGEEDSLGDVSTLADPGVVSTIIAKVKALQGR